MGVQQQQAGNNGEYRIAEKVDGISHFLTIALDHSLEFDNIFGCGFPLVKTVQTINDRQYAEHKIQTDIRHRDILPQGRNKQYHRDGILNSRSAISARRVMPLKAPESERINITRPNSVISSCCQFTACGR